MPERLECEVLQKTRYINTLTFTFTFYPRDKGILKIQTSEPCDELHWNSRNFGLSCVNF